MPTPDPTSTSAPPPAPAIIGPTASGKSALAIAIAEQLNAEIISVDSGAVYRGMNIGTATPNATERAHTPHHLINIASPNDNYNVGRFYRDATAAAADIRARGKTPLFAGGSMMYFNALFNGLNRQPPVPPEIKNGVQQIIHDAIRARTSPAAALHSALEQENPQAAKTLAPTDTQRLMRALCLHRSGDDINDDSDADRHPPLPLNPLLLLPQNRDTLRQRIADRLRQMWEDGLLVETQALIENGLSPAAPALRMAGYKQAMEHLMKKIDRARMETDAYHATSQLAKRQLTWMQKWSAKTPTTDPFDNPNLEQTALDTFRQ